MNNAPLYEKWDSTQQCMVRLYPTSAPPKTLPLWAKVSGCIFLLLALIALFGLAQYLLLTVWNAIEWRSIPSIVQEGWFSIYAWGSEHPMLVLVLGLYSGIGLCLTVLVLMAAWRR